MIVVADWWHVTKLACPILLHLQLLTDESPQLAPKLSRALMTLFWFVGQCFHDDVFQVAIEIPSHLARLPDLPIRDGANRFPATLFVDFVRMAAYQQHVDDDP